jgi:hypothetical protein
MELGTDPPSDSGCLMAAISMVFTAGYAAKRFGIDIDVIDELAAQMEPEDGCISIIHSMDETAEAITAFTTSGLQCLEELLNDRRSAFMKDL